MTVEEYYDKLEYIERVYKSSLRNLKREFAMSKNRYKPGDIISDGVSQLRIEKIEIQMSYYTNLPTIAYKGTELNKSGTVKKKQYGRVMFEEQIKH